MDREIPVVHLVNDDVGWCDLRTLVLCPSLWICLIPVDHSSTDEVRYAFSRLIAALEQELADELSRLGSLADAPMYLIGDGRDAAQRALPSLSSRIRPTPAHLCDQNAYCIAQLAKEAYDAGVSCTDRELTPVYLRPCQAERDLNEKSQSSNA